MSGLMEGLGLTPMTTKSETERAEKTFANCFPLVKLQPSMSALAYELILRGIMQAEADADAAWETTMACRAFNTTDKEDTNA
jgi:hypothetical protein